MIKLRQISKEKLVDKRYYLGKGRNGNVGLWSKKIDCFLIPSWKFDFTVVKYEGYYSQYTGCFQPFILIDECVRGLNQLDKNEIINNEEYIGIGKSQNIGRYDNKTKSFLVIKDNDVIRDKDFKAFKKIEQGKIEDHYPEFGGYGRTLIIEGL